MIGLLSTECNPLEHYYVSYINRIYLPRLILIRDPKGISQRDIDIIHERTDNYFLQIPQNSILMPSSDCNKLASASLAHTYESIFPLVDSLGIRVLVNIGSPRKISPDLISAIPQGIINIHPGYLPYYRGCSAVEWSLLENFPVANSVHFMETDYDSGPIIGIYKTPINSLDTYYQVRQKVHLQSFLLLANLVSKCVELKQTRLPSAAQEHSLAINRSPLSHQTFLSLCDNDYLYTGPSNRRASFFSFI